MTTPAPERLRPAPVRRWMIAVVAVWMAILAGGIVWAVRRGEPTAREQTTVAQALPVVDRASAEVAAAATAGGAVVAVSGFERSSDCSVTVVRSGVRYHRVVTALVPPGTEEAFLRGVARRLPAAYEAVVVNVVELKLKADAGFYVPVTGLVGEPGRVRFDVDTGDCRPEGALPGTGSNLASAVPPAADIFTRLGVRPATWVRHDVACPTGGQMSTLEGRGAENDLPDVIDAALGRVDGLVAATADVYGYRAGGTDVAVRIENSRLVVSATTPCPPR